MKLLLIAFLAQAAVITGTPQSEELKGGPEDDAIVGREGNDSLYGEGGDDTLQGEQDNDRLFGGEGNDALMGGPGNDVLDGGEGNDQLSGDAGDDVLTGGEGDDTMAGGAGNDELSGGQGDDTLDGGPGDDRIRGGPGSDRISGGDGDDVIVPGQGDDKVQAGAGDDLVTISAGDVEKEEEIDCGPGEDRVNLPTIGWGHLIDGKVTDPDTGGVYTFRGCESLSFGGDFGQYDRSRFWLSTAAGKAGSKLQITGLELPPLLDVTVVIGGKKAGKARSDREGRLRLELLVPKLPPATYPVLFTADRISFPQPLYFTVQRPK